MMNEAPLIMEIMRFVFFFVNVGAVAMMLLVAANATTTTLVSSISKATARLS